MRQIINNPGSCTSTAFSDGRPVVSANTLQLSLLLLRR
jgi:hypothetical protein